MFNKSFTQDTADNWFQSSRVNDPVHRAAGRTGRGRVKERGQGDSFVLKKSGIGVDR